MLRAAGIILIFVIVGTLAGVLSHRLLEVSGVVHAPPRSLDGLVLFYDRAVYTLVAMAVAGVLAATPMAQSRSFLTVALAAALLAGVVSALLMPSSINSRATDAAVLIGAMLAAAVAWLVGLMRFPRVGRSGQ